MLNDTKIRAAKAREKPYKVSDGGGLYLLVNPNGSRWWRFKYRFAGKEKLLSLGVYPEVSLKDARARRDENRRHIAAAVDPSAKRQAERVATSNTFESIGREWLALQAKSLAANTHEKAKRMLENFVFPRIGDRPIDKITAPELLAVLKKVEAQGKHETTHRTKQRCGQIFRYAIQTGRAERDVTADLRGALVPPQTENFAAITDPARIGELLRAIDGYQGQPTTSYALKLAPLLFVRPGELRKAEWREFDLDGAEWRIPAERMKMRQQHLVPLAPQAVDLLRELFAITGSGRYVFPSLRTNTRPMSDAAVTAALRRMGYSSDEMTWHGFRSMASTRLNEEDWDPDLIELQLAHAERNKVRAAYNRAQRLADRKKMMFAWATYLDQLKNNKNVVHLRLSA